MEEVERPPASCRQPPAGAPPLAREWWADGTPPEVAIGELERILRGDEAGIRQLVDLLTPTIQFQVARILSHLNLSQRNLTQEVEDLTQEVFMHLFENHAKVLRSWDPARGKALRSFVGLVAQRRVYSVMRSARRSPWTEDPRPAQELERSESQASPARRAESKDRLRRLLGRFRGELSDLGQQMFHLLFVRECSPDEVHQETGMTPEAVYAWRSRLRRQALRLRQELDAEVPSNDP